jgi:predicted 3-demethylubiquinone-9 3-methyltransferase (glyoxalase superfamily)
VNAGIDARLEAPAMLTITPFLWFDTQAEEAMQFYTSIFPNSTVHAVHRAGGRVMAVEFAIEGQRVMGLNGGPAHKFTEAVSFFVGCDTQAQIDDLWDQLIAGGGRPDQCGWLKDRFGLSWQIVPRRLGAMLGDADPARGQRVMQAMLQMVKLDLPALQRAYDGAPATV